MLLQVQYLQKTRTKMTTTNSSTRCQNIPKLSAWNQLLTNQQTTSTLTTKRAATLSPAVPLLPSLLCRRARRKLSLRRRTRYSWRGRHQKGSLSMSAIRSWDIEELSRMICKVAKWWVEFYLLCSFVARELEAKQNIDNLSLRNASDFFCQYWNFVPIKNGFISFACQQACFVASHFLSAYRTYWYLTRYGSNLYIRTTSFKNRYPKSYWSFHENILAIGVIQFEICHHPQDEFATMRLVPENLCRLKPKCNSINILLSGLYCSKFIYLSTINVLPWPDVSLCTWCIYQYLSIIFPSIINAFSLAIHYDLYS